MTSFRVKLFSRPRLASPPLCVAFALLVAVMAAPARSESSAVSYNRQIRPLLSENCFRCHGPDAGRRKAGLRLDQPESAFGKAESGAVAIVPGQPDQSELVRRITTSSDDDLMPPPKEH